MGRCCSSAVSVTVHVVGSIFARRVKGDKSLNKKQPGYGRWTNDSLCAKLFAVQGSPTSASSERVSERVMEAQPRGRCPRGLGSRQPSQPRSPPIAHLTDHGSSSRQRQRGDHGSAAELPLGRLGRSRWRSCSGITRRRLVLKLVWRRWLRSTIPSCEACRRSAVPGRLRPVTSFWRLDPASERYLLRKTCKRRDVDD